MYGLKDHTTCTDKLTIKQQIPDLKYNQPLIYRYSSSQEREETSKPQLSHNLLKEFDRQNSRLQSEKNLHGFASKPFD